MSPRTGATRSKFNYLKVVDTTSLALEANSVGVRNVASRGALQMISNQNHEFGFSRRYSDVGGLVKHKPFQNESQSITETFKT